ncbi:MAG TPA: hypothetical protein VMF89_36355 [Polyangiales bacterium]|nr:hypothetical protein [Polyangiales bacterium]
MTWAKAEVGSLQRWAAALSCAAWFVASVGCDSTCPRGLVKINNRCQAIAQDAAVDAADSGNAAADAAADSGGRTGTTTSPVTAAGAGGSRPNAGSGGSGGSPADAGGGGSAGDAPDAGSAGGGSVTMPEEDVCANVTSGPVCDGAELHVCGDDGRTSSVESCGDATLCETGASAGRCAVCDPGAHRCEGARLDVCDESGQFVLQEMCATAELCKADAGACTEMLCQPNAVACSSDRSSLNTCNADGSDFADMQSCGQNGCDSDNLRCNNCRPGARMCSSGTLITCSDDGQSEQMMRCEPASNNGCATASCEGTGCVYGFRAPRTRCGDGDLCNATGECVECLESGDCAPPNDCYIATCGAAGSCDTQAKPDGTSCGNNRVCRRGECEAPPKTVELKLFYSDARGDNFTTGTAAGEQSALDNGYRYVRVEGYAFETSQPGTVPLRLYYNEPRGDNYTTGTADGEASARGAGYSYARIEGYVYETAQPGTVPFKLYWSRDREDNFTTGTVEGENSALAFNYSEVRVEGYVLTSPNP